MSTLIILAHPNIGSSKINSKLINSIKNENSITVKNLYDLYPDFKIDVKQEQEDLLKANKIIFQFPFYWYNCPALLKEWIDRVMEYNWAFGPEAGKKYALNGKKFSIVVSTGGLENNYQKNGLVGHTLNELLLPFTLSASYLQMESKGSFFVNNAHGISENELNEITKKYIEFVK